VDLLLQQWVLVDLEDLHLHLRVKDLDQQDQHQVLVVFQEVVD
jgi:hypothetical protein|tara:strand:- start:324 stop:452 length:129 start_codon:yes stop_codon:yes gene_type:complete